MTSMSIDEELSIALGIRTLTPDNSKIFKGVFDLLHVHIDPDDDGPGLYRAIHAVRTFPVSSPETHILCATQMKIVSNAKSVLLSIFRYSPWKRRRWLEHRSISTISSFVLHRFIASTGSSICSFSMSKQTRDALNLRCAGRWTAPSITERTVCFLWMCLTTGI